MKAHSLFNRLSMMSCFVSVFLLSLQFVSCTGIGVLAPDKEMEVSSLLTKSVGPVTDQFKEVNFVVNEADVLNYIYRQNDGARRIVSLDPVKRDGENMLYIVNFAEGWSIFSADKHLPPIVAENNTGFFV